MLLTAVMLGSACAGPSTRQAASFSPSPPAGSTPSSTPTSPAYPSSQSSTGPSPSAVPDLPLSTASFSCRLPVLIPHQYADGSTWTGGFLTFPSATYQADSAGVLINRPTGDTATQAQPILVGTGPPFYDSP